MSVIFDIKKSIASKVSESRSIRTKILELKWLPESAECLRALRSERGPEEFPVHGHKAEKPYARPDTGPTRSYMYQQRQYVGKTSRTWLLLYAFLRGRTCASQEAHTNGGRPTAYAMWQTLLEVDKSTTVTTEMLEKWMNPASSVSS
jgi:hypothetical protein